MHCNQPAPLPQALENHWWFNNSFYHWPFSCRPLSDEMCWFPVHHANHLCSQPLATPGFQTAGGVCSCSALCPFRASQQVSKSGPPVKVKIGGARSLVLIFHYRLCIGLIFALIPTDWLWKWEQAHNVHHNRLKCQWSNGAKMLIYQLNVLFPFVRGGHVSHCVIIAAWRITEMLLIFGN